MQMGAAEAELLKYASNALFGVKVSFANEMSELAQGLGLDWESVRQALVLDPRIGDGHLAVPGPDGLSGFGGSCLPKDMAGLVAVAKEAGVELAVTAAALRANTQRRGEGALSEVAPCEGSLNDVVVEEWPDACC
jgi:UDPglucose 6-dehydrogenase